MKRKIFNIYEVIIFMLITAIVSGITSGFIMYRLYDKKEAKVDYSQITKDQNLNEFIEHYNKLLKNYYTDINKSELIQSAVTGMVDYLGEKYTEYLPKDESSELFEQLEGEYKGIGIRVGDNANNEVYVYEVFANTPAEKAGVLVGDIFLKINDVSVVGKNLNDISKQIKYGNEDTLKILLKRGDKEIEVSLTRENVIIPTAITRVINYRRNKIGYMQITTFASITSEQVKTGIAELKNQDISKLIIDLRSNTGGYLDSVTDIAQQFLTKDQIIYSIKTKEDSGTVKDLTDDKTDFKIVILVDQNTASASEILAGALKYSYGALLVGTTTYGKGKMQQTDSVSTGGVIKYTTGEWFLPNDQNIEGIGLIPDISINLDEKYFANPNDANDNQLQKGLEVIIK